MAIKAAQYLIITWHNMKEIGWHTIVEIEWHSIQEIAWHKVAEIRQCIKLDKDLNQIFAQMNRQVTIPLDATKRTLRLLQDPEFFYRYNSEEPWFYIGSVLCDFYECISDTMRAIAILYHGVYIYCERTKIMKMEIL